MKRAVKALLAVSIQIAIGHTRSPYRVDNLIIKVFNSLNTVRKIENDVPGKTETSKKFIP
jgi:hypothetical protein